MTEFVVEPPTFAEAATNARQEALNLVLPRGVALVGCGGVGSWIAYFLALAGVRQLWLFDPDTVSDHNLNRILLPPSSIGQLKSVALAAAIGAVRPQCKVAAMGLFSEELAVKLNLAHEVTWVVASTDTWDSRKEASRYAVEHIGRYIEAAAEGEFGSIADAPGEFATEDEVKAGYASVPVWVGPCVGAAMMACAYILHNVRPSLDLAVRLGWDGRIAYFAKETPTIPVGRTPLPQVVVAR